MTRRVSRFFVCYAVAVAAMGGLSAASNADTYLPEVLFTLEYGQGDQQVGVLIPDLPHEGPPAGPTRVAVGPDGNVYIADGVNDCVKGFDEQGNLRMRTEGTTVNIHHLAVDAEGNVYAVAGEGLDILVKFGPDGKRLWRNELAGAIPVDVWRDFGGGFGEISIGPDETICVQLLGHTVMLAVLDSNGRFLRTYDGRTCTPSGNIASISRIPNERFALEVNIRDPQGNSLAYYVADSAAANPDILAGAPGLSWQFFDAANCTYNVAHASREHKIPLSAHLRITTDIVVSRHDSAGQPVAYLRFPAKPFKFGRDVTVDPAGNVYQLSFGEATVDVIRYRLERSSSQVQALRGLPTLLRAGTRYVPLRLVAEYTGMGVRWDGAAKQVIVSPPAGGGDKSQPVWLSASDPGVLHHYGRLWVSVDTARDKMGVALQMDPKQRIAYLEQTTGREVACLSRL